jgi:hypothetical protein
MVRHPVPRFDASAFGLTLHSPGPHMGTYDGWSCMKSLINEPPPWLSPFQTYSTRTKPPVKVYRLTEAGMAKAGRLHAEAELAGHCSCGLVAKANFCQTPRPDGADKGDRPKQPIGLHTDRLSAVRQFLTPGSERLAHEERLVVWEVSKLGFEPSTMRSTMRSACARTPVS